MGNLQERLSRLSPQQRELLASRLRERLAQERQDPEQAIAPAPAGQPVPLSAAQERLWFLQMLEPEVYVHNLPRVLELKGELDVEALRKALKALVQRHQPLRTVYHLQDGQPVQIVQEQWEDTLTCTDLRDQPVEQRQETADRIIAEATAEPFDLSTDLMLRSRLLRLDDDRYILFLLTHHIASDSWSRGVFYRDLGHFYSAFAGQQPAALPPLPVSYADYAFWQRAQLELPAMDKHARYWQELLAGDPPLLELPADHARPPRPSYHGERVHRELPPELVASLEQLAREEGATLYMVLLSAFYVLLYRYTGQKDLWVGAPVAGRPRAELEQLVGVFINTLVLRCQVDPSLSFRELLQRVRSLTLAAYEHQMLPFERLLERLKPDRDQSHTPLVQVMFNYQNVPAPEWKMAGLQVAIRPKQVNRVPMDLSVIVSPTADGLRVTAEYATDLFERGTMVRLLDHYTRLLDAAVAAPGAVLRNVSFLGKDETRRVLHRWQGPHRQWPDTTLLELWNRQLAATPHAVAFFNDDTCLTYAALERRSNEVAAALQSNAIASGDVVGLCLPRSPEAMAGMIAIFKVGAVLLPLDPNYPQARLQFMLADAGAKLVLTNDSVLQKLPLNPAISLNVDRLHFEYPVLPAPRSVRQQASAPAYIMYTSGSTGQPKGALVPHNQVLNRLHWMWNAYPFAADEIGCQKTALSFVDSLWEIFGPLLKGVPTVIVPDQIVADPPRLVDFLARHGATRLWLVPSLLQAILDNVPNVQQRLPRLKMWVSSGEPITPALWERFRRDVPQATLYNLYGTSEVWDVTWYAPRLESQPRQRVPIGRPLSNVDVFILDEFLNPVPVGVTGELYVGGAAVALGYVNRPELTAARFPLCPFRTANSPAGARMYRSGDLARWLPDGNIEFLGRADSQIKLRGHRIELEEIETHLDRHPAVRQAVAAVHAPGSPDERLVAYCVCQRGQAPTAAELSHFLQAHLPAFMIPSTFLLVDNLPLTPSGKVDRRALPGTAALTASVSAQYTPPQTPTEERLAAIWADLLTVERVGIDDNFFDLGGHSLLAVRLFTRIEESFAVRLPLTQLFATPTVAGLARHLQSAAASTDASSVVAIRDAGPNPPFFCVHGIGGHPFAFRPLVEALPPNFPFYSLRAQGLDGQQPPLTTVEQMAEQYLSDIRAVQPRGPYYLGGYCFGGYVAYEMARQLQRQGEEVALLVVFDLRASSSTRFRRALGSGGYARYQARTLQHRARFHLAQLGTRSAPGRLSYLRQLAGRLLLARSDNAATRRVAGIGGEPAQYKLIRQTNAQALRAYLPLPYDADLVNFQSVEDGAGDYYGWQEIVRGRVQTYFVSGDHNTLLAPPHVDELARTLYAVLSAHWPTTR